MTFTKLHKNISEVTNVLNYLSDKYSMVYGRIIHCLFLFHAMCYRQQKIIEEFTANNRVCTKEDFLKKFKYYVEPDYSWDTLITKAKSGKFDIDDYITALMNGISEKTEEREVTLLQFMLSSLTDDCLKDPSFYADGCNFKSLLLAMDAMPFDYDNPNDLMDDTADVEYAFDEIIGFGLVLASVFDYIKTKNPEKLKKA